MSKSLKSYGVPSSSTGLAMPTIEAVNFEIKPALISMVSQNQYDGHPSDEPTNHLQRFNQLCGTIKHQGVTQDQMKEIEWSAISQAFLEEFFPPTKTAEIRHKLTTFTQEPRESLREAWDRFKALQRSCPHHNIENEVDACYDFLVNLDANHYSATKTTSKRGKMDVDSYTLLSSQVAALNLKIDALKAPQSGTPPMSINAMSSVAPVTSSYCEVGGIIQISHIRATMFKIFNPSNNGHNHSSIHLSHMLLGLHFHKEPHNAPPGFNRPQHQGYQQQPPQSNATQEPNMSDLYKLIANMQKTSEISQKNHDESIKELKNQNRMLENQVAQLADTLSKRQPGK
ncbi:uncharacterized protein [Spinacia oleracea]|uniref:Retrotransposon gag domain-containing protein n=1 Tax=Spinacia oleracea TaxID=3562 RepID=A0ABM3R3S8_SPIOL|nr:uncharacterized protein LOC130465494 [Spinacia oleracea]